MTEPRARVVVGGEALIDLIIDQAGGFTPAAGGGQYNTARALSGEGFQTVSVPVRSPNHGRKEQQLRRDLSDIDLLRP